METLNRRERALDFEKQLFGMKGGDVQQEGAAAN